MRSTLGYPTQIPICIAITAQKHCRASELCLPKWLKVLVQPTHHLLPSQSLTCHISEFQRAEMASQPSPSAGTLGHRMVRSSRRSWWITCTLRGLLWRRCNWDNSTAPRGTFLTYPSCLQIRGSPDQLYLHSTSWGGRYILALYMQGIFTLHCKWIKQRWIGREPGGEIRAKTHTTWQVWGLQLMVSGRSRV